MIDIDDLVFRTPKGTAQIVTDINEQVREYVPAMIGHCRRNRWDALNAMEINLPYRMFVTNVVGDGPRVFINPCIAPYGNVVNEKRHEHVSVHALNLKDEQFLLCTQKGYYEACPDVGLVMAEVLQEQMRFFNP